MQRRDFLKLLGLVGISAGAGTVLFDTAPWLDYDTEVRQIRKSEVKSMAIPAKIKELVRYATLAANGHNTQPWKFIIKDSSIGIIPDPSRSLAVVDPHDRALWISLGCALENLLIAASATGFETEVTYPQTDDTIHVQLKPGKAMKQPLYEAIEWRQCTRAEYDGRPLQADNLKKLTSLQGEAGVTLSVITNHADLEKTAEYVQNGTIQQYQDKAFLAELISWLRFNKREALASLDGLYSRCSGNPEVPRWLGQLFMKMIDPRKQADGDVKKLRSSSGAAVIASDADDRISWVRSGQVCQRLALTMTLSEIRSAFLNQPIEVDDLRMQFGSDVGLGSKYPQLFMRFGYSTPMPYSLRRSTEQVVA